MSRWIGLGAAIYLIGVTPSTALGDEAITRVEISTEIQGVSGNPVHTELSAKIPVTVETRPVLTKLRATPPADTVAYRRAVTRAFALTGVLGNHVGWTLYGLDAAPTLELTPTAATLTASVNGPGPWQLNEDRDFSLPRVDLGNATELIVNLDTAAGSIASARPLPVSEAENGALTWQFSGDRSLPIRVTASPPPYADESSADAIRGVSLALTAALPFLFLLLGLRGWQNARARRLGYAGLAVTFGWMAYSYLVRLDPDSLFGLEFPTSYKVFLALTCAFPLLGLYGATVFSLAPLPSRPASRIRALLLLVFSAGFGVVATAAVYRTGFDFESGAEEEARWLTRAAAVLAVVPISMALYCVGRWFVEVAGAFVRAVPPRSRRWGSLVLTALGLALGLQVLLVSHANAGDFDGFFAGFQAPIAWSQSLAGLLKDLPLLLGIPLSGALTVALLGVVCAGLYEVGRADEVDFTTHRNAFAFSLAFAVAVVGTGGELFGYGAPVAFLATVAVGPALVRALASRPRRTEVRRIAGHEHRDLVQAAVDVSRWGQRLDHLSEPTVGAEAEIKQKEERERYLTERSKAFRAAGVSDANKDQGEALVLEAALYGTTGLHGRLRSLKHGGWWLVAIPVAYGLYSVIDTQGAAAVSARQPLGLAFLGQQLLSQLAIWPVAAFLFLAACPLLPGRHGLAKGLIATAGYVVPSLLAMWVLGDERDGTNALFIAAELGVLLSALGVLVDFRTVRDADLRLRDLGMLYRLTSLRSAVAYAAPAGLLLFTVIEGLASGRGPAAFGDLFANAPELIPAGR